MGVSELEAKRCIAAREYWGDEMAKVRGGGAWVEERVADETDKVVDLGWRQVDGVRGAGVERDQERLTGPDRAGEVLR